MKFLERIALIITIRKSSCAKVRVPNFQEEGNKIELEQKGCPGSLGLEGKFLQFVSETSEHPLYTYIAHVGNKIEKTVVLDNFQTYK